MIACVNCLFYIHFIVKIIISKYIDEVYVVHLPRKLGIRKFGSSEREERRNHATSEVHTRYKNNENIENVNAKHGVKNSSVY